MPFSCKNSNSMSKIICTDVQLWYFRSNNIYFLSKLSLHIKVPSGDIRRASVDLLAVLGDSKLWTSAKIYWNLVKTLLKMMEKKISPTPPVSTANNFNSPTTGMKSSFHASQQLLGSYISEFKTNFVWGSKRKTFTLCCQLLFFYQEMNYTKLQG